MLQCTALRRLPVPETLLRAGVAGDPPQDPVWFASGYAACELAAGHAGEHADHLWDVPGPYAAVWFLWNDGDGDDGDDGGGDGGGGHRFATLRWCTAVRESGDGCELYGGHPPDHSWAVRDPTREVLAAEMAAHPERWGLPPRGDG